MLRIAICDDDQFICSEIEKVILSYKKKFCIQVEIDVFFSGERLIDFIQNEHSYDLIFLDIKLGTITGVDVGRQIRNGFNDHLSKIVFISSKTGYAMELFDVQPMNFLVKPINEQKLFGCLELAAKILEKENKYFEYQTQQTINKVNFQDILYLESKLKKVKIVTVQGKDFFNGSLEKIIQLLPSMFVRSHGSFVVNFNHIEKISKGEVVMTNGQAIPVSRRYFKKLQEVHLEIAKEIKNANL